MSTQDYAARISQIIQDHQSEIGAEWVAQLEALTVRSNVVSKEQLRNHCQQFLAAFANAVRAGELQNIDHRSWDEARDLLADISSTRARGGSTPSETATFVFSLKQPLFAHLSNGFAGDAEGLANASWTITTLLDKLGLFTIESFQRTRDQIIVRQQQELLELSTPVVKLWNGILALPLIGTLDSARTQVVMENILQKIVDTGAAIAIIDITGVPHPPADRPDHRPPRREPGRRDDQGQPGRRLRGGAGAHRYGDHQARREGITAYGTHPYSAHGRPAAGDDPGRHA